MSIPLRLHSLLGTLLTPANPRNLQCEHNRHSDIINITVLTPKRPPKQGKKYAVAYGRRPGVYNTWQEAEQQVKDYPKSVLHRSCNKRGRIAAGRADYLFKALFTKSARQRTKLISGLVELM